MPREELNALVLAVTLVQKLCAHLRQAGLPLPNKVVVCSDSLLNIQRIRRPKLKQEEYVVNRLRIITEVIRSEELEWVFYHIPGDLNPADTPSRLGVESPNGKEAIAFISKVIENDLDLNDTRGVFFPKHPRYSETLEVLSLELQADDHEDFQNVSRNLLLAQRDANVGNGVTLTRVGNRVSVPEPMSMSVVDHIHREAGHLGQSKLRKVINQSYSIKNISRIVHLVCRRCALCQTLKGHRQPSNAEVNRWTDQTLLEGSWRTVGLDIYSMGSTHMLSATDLLSRLIVVEIVVSSAVGYTSKDVAQSFERLCYRTGYGFPSLVYTDNEPIWGSVFGRFLKANGVIVRHVSHYSPFSTFWERLHAEVSKQLKILSLGTIGPIEQATVDKATFIINRRPGPCDGHSAVEIFMLKFEGRTPWDLNRRYC